MKKGLDFKHRVLNILPEKLPVIISALLIAAACIVYYVSYGESRTVSGSYYEVGGAAVADSSVSAGTGSPGSAGAGSSASAGTGSPGSAGAGSSASAETGSSGSAGAGSSTLAETGSPGSAGAGSSTSAGTGSPGSALVNINTADSSRLVTLNGIGQTRAAAIISYRERNGPFRKIEDIMNVPGIKQGIFNKIKNQICTE